MTSFGRWGNARQPRRRSWRRPLPALDPATGATRSLASCAAGSCTGACPLPSIAPIGAEPRRTWHAARSVESRPAGSSVPSAGTTSSPPGATPDSAPMPVGKPAIERDLGINTITGIRNEGGRHIRAGRGTAPLHPSAFPSGPAEHGGEAGRRAGREPYSRGRGGRRSLGTVGGCRALAAAKGA